LEPLLLLRLHDLDELDFVEARELVDDRLDLEEEVREEVDKDVERERLSDDLDLDFEDEEESRVVLDEVERARDRLVVDESADEDLDLGDNVDVRDLVDDRDLFDVLELVLKLDSLDEVDDDGDFVFLPRDVIVDLDFTDDDLFDPLDLADDDLFVALDLTDDVRDESDVDEIGDEARDLIVEVREVDLEALAVLSESLELDVVRITYEGDIDHKEVSLSVDGNSKHFEDFNEVADVTDSGDEARVVLCSPVVCVVNVVAPFSCADWLEFLLSDSIVLFSLLVLLNRHKVAFLTAVPINNKIMQVIDYN
jgi:hypothetical protein